MERDDWRKGRKEGQKIRAHGNEERNNIIRCIEREGKRDSAGKITSDQEMCNTISKAF